MRPQCCPGAGSEIGSEEAPRSGAAQRIGSALTRFAGSDLLELFCCGSPAISPNLRQLHVVQGSCCHPVVNPRLVVPGSSLWASQHRLAAGG